MPTDGSQLIPPPNHPHNNSTPVHTPVDQLNPNGREGFTNSSPQPSLGLLYQLIPSQQPSVSISSPTHGYIWVISPGNVQLPVDVVISIILASASLMSNIFLIQTPINIFDRYLVR